jgi:hypothetical protein
LARLDGLAKHLIVQLQSHCNNNNNDWITQWIYDSLVQQNKEGGRPSSSGAAALCTLWYRVAKCLATGNNKNKKEQPSSSSLLFYHLVAAIGRLLQDIYLDKLSLSPSLNHHHHHVASCDSCLDVLVVNLLHLLEAIIVLRLDHPSTQLQQQQQLQHHRMVNDLLQEIHESVGIELCLPVAMHEMAHFYAIQQQHHPINNNNHHQHSMLSPASKLLLRLTLYDLTVQLSAVGDMPATTSY